MLMVVVFRKHAEANYKLLLDTNGGIVMKFDKNLIELVLSGFAMVVFVIALIGTAIFSV
jgi:hypothetical protein